MIMYCFYIRNSLGEEYKIYINEMIEKNMQIVLFAVNKFFIRCRVFENSQFYQ